MVNTLRFCLFCMLCLNSCYINKAQEMPQVIDVLNGIDKYEKVYCSDYFSSIEFIPLETTENCLLNIVPYPSFLLNDSFIFFIANYRLYSFDKTGKYLNQIGERGQGPGEYLYPTPFLSNTDKPVVFVEDLKKILEYDYSGKFIRSFYKPVIDDVPLSYCFYLGDNLFIGQQNYKGINKYKYYIFNQNGDIVKCFLNQIFLEKKGQSGSTFDGSLNPFQVDNRLYLKDYINDTLYAYTNFTLQPAFIFDFGQYSFSKSIRKSSNSSDYFVFGIGPGSLVGTPKFFFYRIIIPDFFPRPKSKPVYNQLLNKFRPSDRLVYGIYNIAQNTNILLNTDEHLQKGIINDINGGLSFIPKYYAGNNIVVDIWNPEDMLEILTEDYFSTKTITDQRSHQRLKELLKNLKEDDNPVVVLAKLK